MTYTIHAHKMDETKTKPTTIGKAVQKVLVRAFEQDRVNCGVFECVDILDRETDRVMFCILPEVKKQDVSLRIQHTLIEAFCRENDVNILKVDCATKISTIFSSAVHKDKKERTYANDFSCLLVMSPEVTSSEDDFVHAYCENFMLGGVIPHGCIEIPI